jgi:hypothetical protein
MHIDLYPVLPLTPGIEDDLGITEVALIPASGGEVSTTLASKLQKPQTIMFHRVLNGHATPDEGVAFCFHDWCYAILKWKLPLCSIDTIHQLAQTLTPHCQTWQHFCTNVTEVDTRDSLQTLISHATASQCELQWPRLPRLHSDIWAQIWELAGIQTPFSIFLLVSCETVRLVGHLKYSMDYGLSLARGSSIWATSIMIFGISYIRQLHESQESKDGWAIPGRVTHLKVARAIAGICAMKLAENDWESGWIGKLPNVGFVWYATIPYTGSDFRSSYNVSIFTSFEVVD